MSAWDIRKTDPQPVDIDTLHVGDLLRLSEGYVWVVYMGYYYTRGYIIAWSTGDDWSTDQVINQNYYHEDMIMKYEKHPDERAPVSIFLYYLGTLSEPTGPVRR